MIPEIKELVTPKIKTEVAKAANIVFILFRCIFISKAPSSTIIINPTTPSKLKY